MIYDETSMAAIFSDESRQYLWRVLWSVLAEGQSIQGLQHVNITAEQIKELYEVSEQPIELPKNPPHHRVDTHKREFASRCKSSKDIIGIGADHAYVEDNANLIMMHLGHGAIVEKLSYLIVQLALLAEKHSSDVCICHTDNTKGIYTTSTTIGKRICTWINDLDLAHDQICVAHDQLAMMGFKTEAGNQSTAMAMFNGDRVKADALDRFVCDKFGMDTMMIASKTYSRIYDSTTAGALSLLAQALAALSRNLHVLTLSDEVQVDVDLCTSIHKDANRIITLHQMIATIVAVQWIEDNVDVSYIRCSAIPEMFNRTYDCIINMITVIDGMQINPDRSRENLVNRYHAGMADPRAGFAREQTMDYLEAIYKKYDPD